ncbi:MAG: hypothetical protein M1823_003312 [Watsoniomyces obsoletus]|nr:MAG: hypothetical protein M1823_003312 [Watsoniomyces obsoletus]
MPRPRRPPRAGALTDVAPWRILRQIILLQTTYYICATIFIFFTALVAGRKISLDLLFQWQSVRGDTTMGWMLGLVWMLNSLVTVIFILLLVARSKLVPDFAFTIHFIHLLVTTAYSRSLPRNMLWWGLQVASSALMTVLGIWSCQWRELQPIQFGGHRSNEGAGRTTTRPAPAGGGDGGGVIANMLGRAGSSGGEYELVAMKEREGEP